MNIRNLDVVNPVESGKNRPCQSPITNIFDDVKASLVRIQIAVPRWDFVVPGEFEDG